MRQWFAENEQEEPLVLSSFFVFAQKYSHTIQYNGDRFDAPYLKAKSDIYQLSNPLSVLGKLDLYQFIKPLKTFLALDHLRQNDLEQFCHAAPRRFPDGKACISHYRSWIKNRKEEDLTTVLGHNEEDLIGLGCVYQLLSFQGLFQNLWEIRDVHADTEEILFQLTLAYPLAAPVSGGFPGVYLRAEGNQIQLLCHVQNGRLQQFYTNYRDYAYLPAEDCVIPKTLSAHLDKSLQQKATLETCYTWFSCTEDFLNDRGKQKQYLSHLMPYLLKRLGA
jgi:hypothetical protein